MQGRKHVAVKLTSEELRALRRIAFDKETTSVDFVTNLLRKVIKENQHRK